MQEARGAALATSPPGLETLLHHFQLAWDGLGGKPVTWSQLTCVASICQVNENAKQDLKEGLLLYNTENNVGLKNAWNIIQAEVRLDSLHGVGQGKPWVPGLSGGGPRPLGHQRVPPNSTREG